MNRKVLAGMMTKTDREECQDPKKQKIWMTMYKKFLGHSEKHKLDSYNIAKVEFQCYSPACTRQTKI